MKQPIAFSITCKKCKEPAFSVDLKRKSDNAKFYVVTVHCHGKKQTCEIPDRIISNAIELKGVAFEDPILKLQVLIENGQIARFFPVKC